MPGWATREQCRWGRHRWWDSKMQTKEIEVSSSSSSSSLSSSLPPPKRSLHSPFHSLFPPLFHYSSYLPFMYIGYLWKLSLVLSGRCRRPLGHTVLYLMFFFGGLFRASFLLCLDCIRLWCNLRCSCLCQISGELLLSSVQSLGAMWTGRLAGALIPFPILPPSLIIIHKKLWFTGRNHHQRRRSSAMKHYL